MLDADFLANPHVKDCCKVEENLELQHVSHDLLVKCCRVCGCRHFALTVDPLELKLKVS
jgi:hypothetical protein